MIPHLTWTETAHTACSLSFHAPLFLFLSAKEMVIYLRASPFTEDVTTRLARHVEHHMASPGARTATLCMVIQVSFGASTTTTLHEPVQDLNSCSRLF